MSSRRLMLPSAAVALLLAAPLRGEELAAPVTVEVPALSAAAGIVRMADPQTPTLEPARETPQAAAPVSAAPISAAPVEMLSRYEDAHLAAGREHPAVKRYLELLGRLRQTWAGTPFPPETLKKAQLDLAAAVGLSVEDQPDRPLEISSKGDHWLNRWAAGLQASKGVRVFWSPLHNHNGGYKGSYDPRGWIMADNVSPLLAKPTTTMRHEFLHAYIGRGEHAEEFRPLRMRFERFDWHDLPKSKERFGTGYEDGFQADEILTNLHTVYDEASQIVSAFSRPGPGWTASPLDQAPEEVKRLVETQLDRAIFLTESAAEMAAGLLPGARKTAAQGLAPDKFDKDYGRFSRSIPEEGEVEENRKNDKGFYSARVTDPKAPLEIRFFTRGHFKEAQTDAFPVLLSRDGYAARIDLSRSRLEKSDLDDPRTQELVARVAAHLAASRLDALRGLSRRLGPDLERLKSLQKRAKNGVDLPLVREIMQTAGARSCARRSSSSISPSRAQTPQARNGASRHRSARNAPSIDPAPPLIGNSAVDPRRIPTVAGHSRYAP